jgi:ubiquitin-protein ligase
MASYPSNSSSRILHDLQKNKRQEGVCLFLLDESKINEIHAQIEILDGCYKGVKLHTLLKLPQNYPNEGPKMYLPNDFELPSNFHNHIHGKQICADILTNFKEHFAIIDKKKKPKQTSGWVAAYDLNAIFIQMQVFFSEPEFPDGKIKLTKDEIERFSEYCRNYNCECMENPIIQPEGETQFEHLTINDYVCPITRKNLKEEKEILFGYPVLRGIKNGNLELELFIDLFSHEGYLIQKKERKPGENESNSPYLKKKYNYFLPLFINEQHFNPELTTKCLIEIKFGNKQNLEINIHEIVVEVFGKLINRIIASILKSESDAAIQAYCHLLRTYSKLCKNESQITEIILKKFEHFKSEITDRYKLKKMIPYLDAFFINLPFSSTNYDEIKIEFFKELLARQKKRIDEKIDLDDFDIENLEQFLELKNIVFEQSKLGLQLILVNLEATRCLVTEKTFGGMDENNGIIPEGLIKEFKGFIQKIKALSEFSEFFENANLILRMKN